MAKVDADCPRVLHTRHRRGDAEAAAAAFRVLADPGRIRLLNFIARQPAGEACVCHLTTPVGLSQPTVSHHLALMSKAGFLRREKRGAWVFYRVVPERLEAVRAALSTARPGRRAVRRA